MVESVPPFNEGSSKEYLIVFKSVNKSKYE